MCGIGGMLPAMTCAIWRILGVGASFYILHTYTVGSSSVEVYPQAQLASAAARRAFGLSGYCCS